MTGTRAEVQVGQRDSDDTDRLVKEWSAVVPAIDPGVERVVDRLLISARYLERLAGSLAAKYDLQLSDYEILARMFWVGPPHRLRPTQLAAGTMTPVTSVTSRLGRLQRRELIRRVSDTADGRVRSAELTDEGHTLFVRIVEQQAAAEREIFGSLPEAELDALSGLLRTVMSHLEDRLGPAPRRVSLALDAP
ncbi:MAG: MarR family winged helix-turn-helix transcriptional regulator [Micromonosporaceae bacterium]